MQAQRHARHARGELLSPAGALSRDLRTDQSATMRRRRWIIALSLFGAAMGQLVGAYQTGLLPRLPDPKAPSLFNATRVDASDYAYTRLQSADGLLMLGTYALTAILAGAGGRDRARAQPWMPLAMAAKTAYDVVTNVRLLGEEWRSNRQLCQYCLAAHLASWVSAALALPEAADAARAILDKQARPTMKM